MIPEAGDDFPADYDDRIERVCARAADELRSCRDDVLAQLTACCRYFESGEREDISHGELIDYLGVSSPSVFDRAGYSDQEGLRVMELLRLITYDRTADRMHQRICHLRRRHRPSNCGLELIEATFVSHCSRFDKINPWKQPT